MTETRLLSDYGYPDTSNPIIENDRDRRAWAWVVEQVGEEAATQAAAELAGARKPYVSNIAKALGLTLPKATAATPADTARQHLANIKASIKSR